MLIMNIGYLILDKYSICYASKGFTIYKVHNCNVSGMLDLNLVLKNKKD